MYSAGHADIMKHKKDVGGESMLTLDMVREAQEALRGIARRTPLDRAPKFGENVYIKAENLQLTGAFKLRGAYNKIRSLTPEEAARGVIACSAGNHAQGIALSASRLGIKAVICMPAGAPISKVEATRGYGAEVVLVPGVYDDAAAEAERLTKEQGYTFAHPFNDPLVIAGQGTIGLEILEQLPDVEQIVVPIGGGGLIGGIAFAVKQLKPDCRIVGVQAAGAASMYLSRHAGGPTELRSVSNTHVSYLIAESFKYSHIVLASVTYNLGIYPVMKSYLEDMKALNLQNRTFAIIENGSWACKSGDLMQKFIDEEMKNMTVLNERLSMASSLSDDKAVELDALADALVDSIQV